MLGTFSEVWRMVTPKVKKITVFGTLTFDVSENDWTFLCDNSFYTQEPSIEDIESEFVTGTGITPKKQQLWPEASTRFAEYVSTLRRIKGLDINGMCRELLSSGE